MLPDITPSMGKWLKGGLGLFILFQLLVAGCEGKSFLQQQAGRPGEAVSPILPLPYSSGDYERNLVVGLPETGDTLMDDDGSSLESAIMNYLNTKRMIQRMKQQIDATSNSIQQRKRTNGNYWKMCAFNAVSCFG